jgi:MAP/microtubule affinity-regulating kinase
MSVVDDNETSTANMNNENPTDKVAASGEWNSKTSVSGQDTDIRTVRFAFNMSTTSTQPPAVIMARVTQALTEENVTFNLEGYLFTCSFKTDKSERDIEFELEVCKIPRLALHGIRMKRVKGDIWEYKKLCTRLMKLWNDIKQ